ncbi:MAG: DegT/DnrJ/EryC1/StrS family aminotransferase [Candidatus Dormiibacterota bacterium]
MDVVEVQKRQTGSRGQVAIAAPWFGEEEESAVLEVMRSGVLVQGARVREFETRFAEAVGSRHAVATSSGSTALHLALLAHGVGPEDEVVTSAQSFIASANAIAHVGARPVFADVDETLNIGVETAARAFTRRTKAILAVHLHGNPADLDALRELAEKRGAVLVQDACQAIGASLQERRLGAFGTAVYSLYATKNLTTGEGGMIATNDDDVARRCRRLRHQAYADEPYVHDEIGHNYRLTEIQAAIGIVQLRRLSGITAARRRLAARYDARLDPERFRRPRTVPGACPVYHQYTIRFPGGSPDRDRARVALADAGVASGIYYPLPLHLQPPYRNSDSVCPEAERAAADMLSIPVHPGVSDDDVERVVEVLLGR